MKRDLYFDYLVIGGGVIGLTLARSLRSRFPGAQIGVLDKEPKIAAHGSGRNSGVLHAGFYYSAESLKAKFCKEGNRRWQLRCQARGLGIVRCGKLVVTKDERDLEGLKRLHSRGQANGIDVKIVSKKEAAEIEPLAQTFEAALYSPTTAVLDPVEAMEDMANELRGEGVQILFGTRYIGRLPKKCVQTNIGKIGYGTLINSAGLYADRIARDFGLAKKFIVMPFKGIYLYDKSGSLGLKTHIYPVPDLRNPFLGVHFTVTAKGVIKMGPTAIPAFWRENYTGFEGFSPSEMLEVIGAGARLWWANAFDFRSLSKSEFRKYDRRHLFKLGRALVPSANEKNFKSYPYSGIRAQLLNTETQELVQDFVVERAEDSIHILNAVSPGFTASLPFTDWIVSEHLKV